MSDAWNRKKGTKWDFPRDRKFRRVTALVAKDGISVGASYEVERAFNYKGEPYLKLKGVPKPLPAWNFATTMSTHPTEDPLSKLAGYHEPVTEGRKVKAIADDRGITEGEVYEVAEEWCQKGDHWYKLKGKRKHYLARKFVNESRLDEASRLTRAFAKRLRELEEDEDKYGKLSREFNVHEFTARRLAREAQHLFDLFGEEEYLEQMAMRQMVKEMLFGKGAVLKSKSEISIFSESILSESILSESEKCFTGRKMSLREKEDTDAEYRELADDIIDKLDDHLYDNPKLHKIGKYWAITGETIAPALNDLIFLFSKKSGDDSTPAFGDFKPVPGIKAVSMPILDTDQPTHDDIQNAIAQERESLGHELIHYIDHRRGVPVASTKQLQKKGVDAYVNTPEEYNAYYQEGMARLMRVAKMLQQRDDLGEKQDILPLSFREFVKSDTGEKIMGSFVKHLEPKYRRKYVKRLYDAYPKVINTAYSEKERAQISNFACN